jgi:hypothetical protein
MSASSFLFIDANLHYLESWFTGIALTHRELVTTIYAISLIVLFMFYAAVLRYSRHFRFIYLIPACIVLFLMYPGILSYDIFNYIATAKVTFLYGENPYIIMPIDIPNEPMLSFLHAANKTALYGPVWIALTGLPYLFGSGHFIVTMYLFKLLPASGYLLIAWCIYRFSNKQMLPVLFFAAHPLILIETFGAGHNDTIMIGLALLSLYTLMKKKLVAAFILLALASAIKFATLILIPIYLYAAWKIRRSEEVSVAHIATLSALAMGVIFLLSFIREEMYPWYAIWVIPFAALSNKRILWFVSGWMGLGMMLRYIPWMLLGTHSGIAPLWKLSVSYIGAGIGIAHYLIAQRFSRTIRA